MTQTIKNSDTEITCQYCGKPAKLVTGDKIYAGRDDLKNKLYYRCDACDAHVGCHPGSQRPMGELANASLRKSRMDAHAAFDPVWKTSRHMNRTDGYAWLAGKLNIKVDDCHIGYFDEELCKRTIDVCNKKTHKKKVCENPECNNPARRRFCCNKCKDRYHNLNNPRGKFAHLADDGGDIHPPGYGHPLASGDEGHGQE